MTTYAKEILITVLLTAVLTFVLTTKGGICQKEIVRTYVIPVDAMTKLSTNSKVIGPKPSGVKQKGK